MTLVEQVKSQLSHAKKRDAEKGGDGSRTTRELADACGVRIDRMRRLLNGMMKSGEVVGWQDHTWSLPETLNP